MKTHSSIKNIKSVILTSLFYFFFFMNTGFSQQIYTENGGALNATDALGAPAHPTDVGIGTANPQAKFHIGQTNLFVTQNYMAPSTVNASKEGLLMQAYINSNDDYRRYADIASIGYQSGTAGGSIIRFLTNNEDNSNAIERMRIDRNGFIGIRNTAPLQALHVSSNLLIDGAASSLYFGEGTNSNNVGEYGIEYDGQTAGVKGLNFWKAWGSHNGGGGQGFRNYILFLNDDGNVSIGVDPVSIDPAHKLSVCGIIRATEVVVNTGWCDFVFEKNYKLRSIEEVESYINENGHLPEIPTTKEVEESGVSLGNVQAKLLQKIEELTLYVIDLNKQNQELQCKVNELVKK